jgi:hypothetical protein
VAGRACADLTQGKNAASDAVFPMIRPPFSQQVPRECGLRTGRARFEFSRLRRYWPGAVWVFAAVSLISSPLAVADGALKSADNTIRSKVVDDESKSVTETISDAHGKLQKKTVLFFGSNDWYDKTNWSTGAVHYNTDNTIRYKESYQRDAKGVMQQTWLYSKDDRVLGHRVFHYDANGKVDRVDDFDAEGRLLAPAAQRVTPASSARPDKKKK